MSAPAIQITEPPIPDDKIGFALSAWLELLDPNDRKVGILEHLNGFSILELQAYESWPNLEQTSIERKTLWDKLVDYVAGDLRREILAYVEEPKPALTSLPDTKYPKLRYVEVLPRRYAKCREWRQHTIFDVVQTSEEICTFAAYHTVFSTCPSVLFLSGFDGDFGEYSPVFTSDRYRKIIDAAGSDNNSSWSRRRRRTGWSSWMALGVRLVRASNFYFWAVGPTLPGFHGRVLGLRRAYTGALNMMLRPDLGVGGSLFLGDLGITTALTLRLSTPPMSLDATRIGL